MGTKRDRSAEPTIKDSLEGTVPYGSHQACEPLSSFFIFILCWSIAELQCVSFRCPTK